MLSNKYLMLLSVLVMSLSLALHPKNTIIIIIIMSQ